MPSRRVSTLRRLFRRRSAEPVVQKYRVETKFSGHWFGPVFVEAASHEEALDKAEPAIDRQISRWLGI